MFLSQTNRGPFFGWKLLLPNQNLISKLHLLRNFPNLLYSFIQGRQCGRLDSQMQEKLYPPLSLRWRLVVFSPISYVLDQSCWTQISTSYLVTYRSLLTEKKKKSSTDLISIVMSITIPLFCWTKSSSEYEQLLYRGHLSVADTMSDKQNVTFYWNLHLYGEHISIVDIFLEHQYFLLYFIQENYLTSLTSLHFWRGPNFANVSLMVTSLVRLSRLRTMRVLRGSPCTWKEKGGRWILRKIWWRA